MKILPMTCSDNEVRSILNGGTQVRRLIKPQPIEDFVKTMTCPYGSPGYQPYVKECFQTGEYFKNDRPGTVYRATDTNWKTIPGWKWKPSMIMPRALSRILLEITAIRVERVQEVPEESKDSWDAIHGESSWDIYPIACWNSNPLVWVIDFKRI